MPIVRFSAVKYQGIPIEYAPDKLRCLIADNGPAFYDLIIGATDGVDYPELLKSTCGPGEKIDLTPPYPIERPPAEYSLDVLSTGDSAVYEVRPANIKVKRAAAFLQWVGLMKLPAVAKAEQVLIPEDTETIAIIAAVKGEAQLRFHEIVVCQHIGSAALDGAGGLSVARPLVPV